MTHGEKQGTHQENRLTDIQMDYNFRAYFNYFEVWESNYITTWELVGLFYGFSDGTWEL
jgi:hypothetical protein